jgi:hypothetical protein
MVCVAIMVMIVAMFGHVASVPPVDAPILRISRAGASSTRRAIMARGEQSRSLPRLRGYPKILPGEGSSSFLKKRTKKLLFIWT